MAYQSLNIGSTANDATGDTLRAGGDKINDNFLEIYTALGTGSALTSGISSDATVVTLTAPIISGTVAGDITLSGTLLPTGDTAAGDNAAIGYTSAEGLILTGQGSTSDITLKNDADGAVFTVPTGTDDILFPDDAKAMWGAGSDLQIYHDVSNSFISDQGTGFIVMNSGEVRINNAANDETMARFVADGAVTLSYDNTAALATASGGGTLTGTWNVTTAFTPDASDGAALGTAALEWSDLYIADGGVIYFGDDQDVTITHDPDDGLFFKSIATADNNPLLLTLQTGETYMVADEPIVQIHFQVPDEASGTDAILVCAGIEAVAEGSFSSSSNATKLSFLTASSAAAAETMSLSSGGNLTVTGTITGSHGTSIAIGKALAVAMLF